jgi:hypothetical protein
MRIIGKPHMTATGCESVAVCKDGDEFLVSAWDIRADKRSIVERIRFVSSLDESAARTMALGSRDSYCAQN